MCKSLGGDGGEPPPKPKEQKRSAQSDERVYTDQAWQHLHVSCASITAHLRSSLTGAPPTIAGRQRAHHCLCHGRGERGRGQNNRAGTRQNQGRDSSRASAHQALSRRLSTYTSQLGLTRGQLLSPGGEKGARAPEGEAAEPALEPEAPAHGLR